MLERHQTFKFCKAVRLESETHLEGRGAVEDGKELVELVLERVTSGGGDEDGGDNEESSGVHFCCVGGCEEVLKRCESVEMF